MKQVFFAIAACAAASVALAQTTWDFPTGYSPNSFQTQNLQQFADEVDKATNGTLKFRVHSNGSLFRQPEIKRAVATGQAQIGEFIISGASNENALFGIDSVPFLATSYADARRLWNAAKPATEKLLDDQGLKLLYVSPWPPQGLYSLKKPINSAADLAGMRMRTFNPATARIAQILKASPVQIQLAELSQALGTGIVETFLTSSASGVETKLYESVKYFYDVNAWLPKNAVVVSKKAFDSLDKKTQDTVIRLAQAAETRGWKLSEQKDQEYMKELQAKGMTVGNPSDQLRKELMKIGETMTQEWVNSAGPEGKAIIDAYMKR